MGDERLLTMAQATLDAMAAGGIYDQLGGGFHRYSTDASWRVPHFEKMLYDNGLLLSLYAEGYRQLATPRYAEILRESASYLSREMTSQAGCFYAAQDADSEGEEGRFFVWTPQAVEAALGDVEDAALACLFFGVTPEGQMEGRKSVLAQVTTPSALASRFLMDEEKVAAQLQAAKERLFAIREERAKPARDEKQIASWNALTIQGLTRAAMALDDASLLAQAQKAAARYLDDFAREGQIHHLAYEDEAGKRSLKQDGFLDDQALMALAWIDLALATGDLRYMEAAQQLGDTFLERFADGEGCLRYTHRDAEPLIVVLRHALDEAIPSAVGAAALALLRIALWTGKMAYRDTAEKLFLRYGGDLQKMPSAFPTMLRAWLAHEDGLRMVVAILPQDAQDEAIASLRATLCASLPPDDLCLLHREGDPYPPSCAHLLQDRHAHEDKITFYICDFQTCRPPLHDLRRLLDSL
jgi:uncharacterized protein YyaL (SSP411 family)